MTYLVDVKLLPLALHRYYLTLKQRNICLVSTPSHKASWLMSTLNLVIVFFVSLKNVILQNPYKYNYISEYS